MEIYSLDDPLSAVRRIRNLLLWAMKPWPFGRNKVCIWCKLAWRFCEQLDGAFLFGQEQFQQIFNSLTIRKDLDFKREYLFRMCSVVIYLVTSLEFQPIRCATTLFHFGRTQNGYVATRFFLLSSTAESSPTSGSVVAPEHSGNSEAWAGRDAERARKKPSFNFNSGFNRCSFQPHVDMNSSSNCLNSTLGILNYLSNAIY